MRYPAVAGQFYSADEDSLREELRKCFTSPLGPGEQPVLRKGERRVKGVVAPHAGYMYSGPVAAHDYYAIAEDGFPETFVILGPNHTGAGAGVAVTTQDFQTPLGVVEVDKELAKSITKGIIQDDISAHRYEHSIEVQLPFLQFIRPEIRFVPICMALQNLKVASQVGNIIREAIEGRDVVIIASTDFSHYVPYEVAKKKDNMAIEEILKVDPKGLYTTVAKNNISMCGYGPVISMLTAVGEGRGELLKYATSGDVHPMREVVGYAAIVVK